MDEDSIVAGVLHDTVEDTNLTLRDIEEEFGKNVAFLVNGVTKLGKARSGMKDLDEYLQFYYGPGNDEVHFRSVLERYYLADAYSAIYCDEYEFEDSVKYVPYVRYALFYAPDTAEQAEKDKALEQANKMKLHKDR